MTINRSADVLVTPYVGVWIETEISRLGRNLMQVTPYVGVWIETWAHVTGISPKRKSLLMWECGLKQGLTRFSNNPYLVTPYVGVWIETNYDSKLSTKEIVTPYVGVWIETHSSDYIAQAAKGHSLCGSVD